MKAKTVHYPISRAIENLPGVWRCFHCDEVFTDAEAARLHFGPTSQHKPACQLDVKYLRQLETELERYRAEDTDLHRQLAQQQTAHQFALRRAEEAGYSQGLRDVRQLKP